MNKEENKKLNSKIIIYGVSICVLFGIAVKLFISITDASVNEDLRIEESNLGESSFEDIEKQKNELNNWILWARDCPIERFNKCATTISNWYSGITNSLVSPYTNGFTEGCNNRIKVLKRLAYGYTNFRRFRNRILHIFNSKNNSNINEAVA